MCKSSESLLAIAFSFALAGTLVLSPEAASADDSEGISWETEEDVVTIQTDSVCIAISRLFPAAAARETDAPTNDSYGFVLSSIMAYNESGDAGLLLETVPYHASLEHATWNFEMPVVVEAGGVSTAYVEMSSSVTMNKRVAFGGGNPTPGEPGIEKIENWATVTVGYTISTSGFSSTFEGTVSEGEYPVNGSTEVKFDVRIDVNIPIDATRLALDVGLMKMEFGTLEPTAMDEQYVFRGYQSDGTVISDPDVNETDGAEIVMHTFLHRSQLKQLFAFVEDNETGFFSWASKVMSTRSGAEPELTDVTTYYRTDGEMLKLYISSALSNDTTTVLHDPSLGVYPGSGGYIRLPDEGLLGSSVISVVVGVLVGVAVAGGVGVFVAVRRSSSEDQTDVVVLEKNRYYKRK